MQMITYKILEELIARPLHVLDKYYHVSRRLMETAREGDQRTRTE